MPNNNVAEVLWTGGWDSTYRLLELLLVQRRAVQPRYIIDTGRPSTINEIKTIAKIRHQIVGDHPELEVLIRPLLISLASDVKQSKDLKKWHDDLSAGNSQFPIQYHWLAEYARTNNIEGMELSVEKKPGGILYELLKGNVSEVRSHADSYYVVKTDPKPDSLRLFSAFRFPVLETDKPAMQRLAVAHGFDSYLNMTWFCHRPISGRPCGTCSPCRDTADAGLAYRIPWYNRTVRRNVHRPLSKAWQTLLEGLRPRRRLRAIKAMLMPADSKQQP
jgi:hypothetical protein